MIFRFTAIIILTNLLKSSAIYMCYIGKITCQLHLFVWLSHYAIQLSNEKRVHATLTKTKLFSRFFVTLLSYQMRLQMYITSERIGTDIHIHTACKNKVRDTRQHEICLSSSSCLSIFSTFLRSYFIYLLLSCLLAKLRISEWGSAHDCALEPCIIRILLDLVLTEKFNF